MSHDASHLPVAGADGRDDELFTSPSTDPTPDRHPSVLRPGGHASPLSVPAALRPGAGRHSRTPSPLGTPAGFNATQSSSSPYASPLPVTYKAYVPPSATKPQGSSDALSAEIEGYFTNLQVAPLAIRKNTASPEPSLLSEVGVGGAGAGEFHSRTSSLEGRCVSPPVPPKERISCEDERPMIASTVSELDAAPAVHEEADAMATSPVPHTPSPPSPPAEAYFEESEHPDEPPPAYEETESVPPPPEKVPISHLTPANEESLTGPSTTATVASEVVSSPPSETVPTPTIETVETAEAAATPTEHRQADEDDIYGASDDEHKGHGAAASSSTPNKATATKQEPPSTDDIPPPLPPRPTPSPVMPGAYPPPPTRPVGGAPSSSPSSKFKASGAAATSAAGVGAAVAGVGQNSSLHQARKALEKGIGHLIDKAKEHQAAREQQQQKQNARKSHHGGATVGAPPSSSAARGSRKPSPDRAKKSTTTTEQGHVAQGLSHGSKASSKGASSSTGRPIEMYYK